MEYLYDSKVGKNFLSDKNDWTVQFYIKINIYSLKNTIQCIKTWEKFPNACTRQGTNT